MQQANFEQIERDVAEHGGSVAIARLCAALRERRDYASLFYALLMKKRFELGVSPVPTEPVQALPAALHAAYEDGIREAGREVGMLYLQQGDIPRAWAYFRMIGEPGPVAAALEEFQLGDGEDSQQVIEIAFHQGVQPRKGFDWILERFGICSAITTVSGHDFSQMPEARVYCIQRLVRALHAELVDRLKAEMAHKEGTAPETNSVPQLIAGRDWLFADEFYHVDVSHLSSVVQFSLQLPDGEELGLARELCAYGARLSTRFQYPGEPPFEDLYRDCGVYLSILGGVQVEEGLDHFRAKVAASTPENEGTMPAEVLVNLLVRLNRLDEAVAVARKRLAGVTDRPLNCPSITELCQRTGDYQTLAEAAREQGDPVHFLAGLLAANAKPN
jgi:hypothetical protein